MKHFIQTAVTTVVFACCYTARGHGTLHKPLPVCYVLTGKMCVKKRSF